ncbi:TetR/AcrR family transcriptional regulator [Clostridium oryzae]|uniref:Biofilm operon icaADBC HTH-type negative transcriptional regulator IcaR n=1 Tax=Clostridium oryzae TaxID=1450648 RepID=A0A1V4I5D8_9CLOT|nr:TetR/AcrR family transcriptional regulator [Clostridium oryzae]OPJ55104.1 biofilm operon icaADBC HTH-type negative transcriptional regulator IcaR [Clostridium oryzae]
MNIPNARERILDAAVKVFADKSFEGSRIDEIASAANVPKSLIYYHFKNKDEILEILTKNFISDYLNIIESDANESHKEKFEQLGQRMQDVYYEFGKKNADLVRVIFIDSLKKTKEQPIFFKVIEAMIAKEKESNKDSNYDEQERRISEFFTSFIPNCAYICFADSWIKYFNMDKSKFDRLYLKVYEETHGAYHRNHK